jgi:hypothetical protein
MITLSAALSIVEMKCNSQLMYTSSGKYRELEAAFTPWMKAQLGKGSMSLVDALDRWKMEERGGEWGGVAGPGGGGMTRGVRIF